MPQYCKSTVGPDLNPGPDLHNAHSQTHTYSLPGPLLKAGLVVLSLEGFVRQTFGGRRRNHLGLLKAPFQSRLIPNSQCDLERRGDSVRVGRVLLVVDVIDVGGHRLALGELEGQDQPAVYGVQDPVREVHRRAHAGTGAKRKVQRRRDLAVLPDPALWTEFARVESVDARVW